MQKSEMRNIDKVALLTSTTSIILTMNILESCAKHTFYESSHLIFKMENFFFFLISWRLITSQHCSGFCHTLT